MKSKGMDLYLESLQSQDDGKRHSALLDIMKMAENKVDWFLDYKDVFIQQLTSSNSYQRSIGIMILCSLVINETSKNEYKTILPLIMKGINDEKFITQRQYIQNIYKIAIHKKEYGELIIKQLEDKYIECENEKHFNLIREDIIKSLKEIASNTNSDTLYSKIELLIEKEVDIKNRKKYRKVINN